MSITSTEGSGNIVTTEISTTGATVVTIPADTLIHYILVGAGGGGSGARNDYVSGSDRIGVSGSGGGGGQVREGAFYSSTAVAGGVCTVTIGAGGALGAGTENGNSIAGSDGGDSTIAFSSGSFNVTSYGGTGAGGSTSSIGVLSSAQGGFGGGWQQGGATSDLVGSGFDTFTDNRNYGVGGGPASGEKGVTGGTNASFMGTSGARGIGGGGGSGIVGGLGSGNTTSANGGAAADCEYYGKSGMSTNTVVTLSAGGAGGGSYGNGGSGDNTPNGPETSPTFGGGGGGGMYATGAATAGDGNAGADGYCLLWWEA